MLGRSFADCDLLNSIVLVHGLFGHPKDAWTSRVRTASASTDAVHGNRITGIGHEENPHKKLKKNPPELFHEVFWPRDLLPSELPQARVLTWGYDVDIAHVFSKTSKASILQHAETLLSDLVSLRCSKSEKSRPIIFIAHSLGGIVVKDALSLSKNESTHLNEILPAAKGVIFLGTPHHGSDMASLGKIAAEMSRIFIQNPNVQVLRALESNSEILERISRSFGQVLYSGQLNVHSFQEELETKGVKVVTASSSTIGYLHEVRSTLHANHRDMAKFSSHNDANFQRVKSVLSRWIEDIEQSKELPEPSSNLKTDSDELPDGLIFDKAYCDCLAGLNSDTRIRFDNVKPTYENTYDWLFDQNVGFGSWLAGEEASSLFWIRGKPGSGKSTIMKYAMTSPRTTQLLSNHNIMPWIIAGFFFHDRGTEMQKSAEGFLSGILRQLLEQCKALFPVIYSKLIEFGQISTINEGNFPITKKPLWTLAQLQQILSLIICQPEVPLNCCLFVDALDEHDGNHRDLVAILMDLARASEASTTFQLRLCLAGRPENVFKTTFQRCPGFAIHDYTTRDIRHYAEDRINKEHFSTLTDDDVKATAPLVEQIVRKANGVFLWVTLVVNELVEGLCEGDTITEMEQLLSEIPEELEDLYTRAIHRVPRTASSLRTSPSALRKHRYETYVMFQIAMHALKPLPITEFMGAVCYSTLGESSVNQTRTRSQDQLERRLNSKSAGLLEAVFVSEDGVDFNYVQFIHQTTKEYISSSSGQSLLTENLGNKPLESGTLFILRYIISHLTLGQTTEESFALGSFEIYAEALEDYEHVPFGRFFEPMIKSREQIEGILEYNSFIDKDLRWWTSSRLLRGTTTSRSQDVSFMVFYISLELYLSLRSYIANRRDYITQGEWYLLFQWVFKNIGGIDPYAKQILLDANVDAEISGEDFHDLMNFDYSKGGYAAKSLKVQELRAQLQERRDKRYIPIKSDLD